MSTTTDLDTVAGAPVPHAPALPELDPPSSASARPLSESAPASSASARAARGTFGRGPFGPAWIDNPRVNVVLFLATLFSTTYAGVDLVLQDGVRRGFVEHLGVLSAGLPFSLSLLAILLTHELGHFFVGRLHGVRVTLPFFVPVPGLIGTMGAVILMRSPVVTRRALLDIGAAGPLAGMAVALPLMAVGLHLSHVVPLRDEAGIGLGESLLVRILAGAFAPPAGEGQMLAGHPLFLAAWFGFLVTAINLLPIGQLDGGHVAYAILGRRQRPLALGLMGLLAVLAFWFYGWFIWLLILSLMGPAHPPVLAPEARLDPLRRGIALVTLAVLVLTFTPVPFRFYP